MDSSYQGKHFPPILPPDNYEHKVKGKGKSKKGVSADTGNEEYVSMSILDHGTAFIIQVSNFLSPAECLAFIRWGEESELFEACDFPGGGWLLAYFLFLDPDPLALIMWCSSCSHQRNSEQKTGQVGRRVSLLSNVFRALTRASHADVFH